MTVDQADKLRQMVRSAPPGQAPAPAPARRARVIAITSGKGGVGKSSIALNLAVACAAHHRRVVLFDADFGLANLDLLCGLSPSHTLADVISGRRRLDEVAVRTPFGFELVPGASGIPYIADLPDEDRTRLLVQLEILEREADLLIIDTGAGVAKNVVALAAAADDVFVVATPEPTSITDAYAAVKLVSRQPRHGALHIVVNQAASGSEASRVASRVASVARRFLSVEVKSAGYVLSDPKVARAVRLRRPLVAAFPASPAALCISTIAKRLRPSPADGRPSGFVNRLKTLFRRR